MGGESPQSAQCGVTGPWADLAALFSQVLLRFQPYIMSHCYAINNKKNRVQAWEKG